MLYYLLKMGNAYSTIYNDTGEKGIIYTYNNADVVYGFYKNKYEIEVGATQKVEASADVWGLKVQRARINGGITYSPHVRSFKNGSTINMSSLPCN